MSTLDLVQQDENTTFFLSQCYRGQTKYHRKKTKFSETFSYERKRKDFFFKMKYLKIKCILVKHNES